MLQALRNLAFKVKVLAGPAGKPLDPDLKHFFEVVRKHLGKLSQAQVDGFELIIEKFKEVKLEDLRWLAYMLATAWHETSQRMEPIVELGGERYLKKKAYYPYYGRGFAQLTWKLNYEKYGIADHPEKALEPALAAHIIVDGMVHGVFTGHRLQDYFNRTQDDAIGARRIINGTDRAKLVAGYHAVFVRALTPVVVPIKKMV